MRFLTVMNLLGGIAVFIFGIRMMSAGLNQLAGRRMRKWLQLFAKNRVVAVMTGAAVTAVIQSSGASTVMVLGFVNAGLLNLVQAIGIIFGANIGTTMTAQLVAFDMGWIVMPSICAGVILGFLPQKHWKHVGEAILGLGFLFLGLRLMETEFHELRTHPSFLALFQRFACTPVDGMIPPGNFLGAMLMGVVVTVVLQSSSACVGIIIALGSSGVLDFDTAIPIMIGSNIGATAVTLLASLTANRIAKQAALAHTMFNVIGAVILAISFWLPPSEEPLFLRLVKWISPANDLPRQIANAHTLFKVSATILFLPFVPYLARLCEWLIPTKAEKEKFQLLETHLLKIPSIALRQTRVAMREMLQDAWGMVDCALRLYNRNDEANQAKAKLLDSMEESIDERQHDITRYLAKIMEQSLTAEESKKIPAFLHCTNDTERIGDHTAVIRDIMYRVQDAGLRFSKDAEEELGELHRKVSLLAEVCANLLDHATPQLLNMGEATAEELNGVIEDMERRHLLRVKEHKCQPEAGLLFLELVDEMNKLTRHLSNIVDRASLLTTGA